MIQKEAISIFVNTIYCNIYYFTFKFPRCYRILKIKWGTDEDSDGILAERFHVAYSTYALDTHFICVIMITFANYEE